MGNCWPKRKVDYSQKRDRIKMWVESLPNMEVPEPTNLVRINAMPDISVLSPALSKTSLCSISSVIFFDAREYIDSGDEESAYDDALEVVGDVWDTGRRRELPVIKTETEGVNLWNLLCKNIGKDLSKISMPVTLNEPLSTLQWLCEELEYSDLVDKAVSSFTPLERMSWVAAFAISGYSSTRARYKPFNPLLGETYECVRKDKGFRFVGEQVSHHPPVSCVHATGIGWSWSQTLRIRSKFWGKSMEFQPEGSVHLTLHDHGEEYTWNKVTSCIYNLLGQDRWVDLYGESVITCKQSGLTARILFLKTTYWSNKKHEVVGTITDNTGAVLQNLFGKWSEALYVGKAPSGRCIWRAGSEDTEPYYGFSRFAVELNEMTSVERSWIPPTDARLRPDQKALEEGRLKDAENIKLRLEQAQRDRRRQREIDQVCFFFLVIK